MDLLLKAIPTVGIVAIIIFLVVITWRKAPQDKAIVITGLKKRVISGAGGFVIPFLEQADKISLENIKVELKTQDSMDSNGVPIDTDGVAIIKVKSDMDSILLAMEQFNTGNERGTIGVINSTAQDVLEGKLREIISKMTVEEIYKDREKFADEVEKVAKSDFEKMGLEFKTFTIRDIDDKQGYLKSLGAKQIAEVQKNAAIAIAEADKEQKLKTAEAARLGKEAEIQAETQIAEAQKNKELKVQAYKEEQEKSKAKADFSYQIEENMVKRELIEAQKNAELFESQKQTEIAMQDSIKKEKELEASIKKIAEAEKYKQLQLSESLKINKVLEAEAEAEAIRIKGSAEAETIRMKGIATADAMKAEAEAMKEKAEAYKQYGEAAMVQMLVEKLPEIARHISEPLSRTEKMIIIDNGGQGGASKVTKNVTNIMAELPAVVESLTGINLLDLISNIGNKNDFSDSILKDTILKDSELKDQIEMFK